MLNKFIGMGRLTASPELKSTSSGTSVTSFTIAVDRNYGGTEKQTDFIPCVAWRSTAEFICKYFTKGQLISIEASLQTRSYENRDGKKVTVLEAVVDNVYFTGDKRGSNNGQNNGFAEDGFAEYEGDDDLPFN